MKYLETKDETWPLLLPMVKSVTRAMDALQDFAKAELKAEVKDFVITGASKRGWTSWLTAASGDKRVKAIAPLVIDTLDFPRQMKNQVAAFGKPSEMIADYTRAKLVPIPDTTEAKKLWQMIDPFVYREALTLPKMIINGTNDPYWSQDALNLYWDDLQGDKWILYVPNAGHNLQQKHDGPTLLPDLTRARNTLAAFSKSQIYDLPMPKLTWKHEGTGAKMLLKVQADPAPKAARLWSAQAATRDFRKAKWSDRPLEVTDKGVAAEMAAPEEGFVAFFAELEYEIDGLRYYLSTQLRVAGKGN